jgi:hypothetical protein
MPLRRSSCGCPAHGAPALSHRAIVDGQLVERTADAAGARARWALVDFGAANVVGTGKCYGGPEGHMRTAACTGPTMAQARDSARGHGAVGGRHHDPRLAPHDGGRSIASSLSKVDSGVHGHEEASKRLASLHALGTEIEKGVPAARPVFTGYKVREIERTQYSTKHSTKGLFRAPNWVLSEDACLMPRVHEG